MTIILDMANGSIQSVTKPESGHDNPLVAEQPLENLHLAQQEATYSEPPSDKTRTAVHLIRALLAANP